MRNPHLANVFYRPHLSALCLQSQRVEPLFQAGGGGMAIEQPAFADVGAGGADLQVLAGLPKPLPPDVANSTTVLPAKS